MFKKTLFLAAVLSTLLACNSQAEVIHSTWVGGESGYWSNNTNWDPPIVPFNSPSQKFYVTIDSNSIGAEKIEIYLDCPGCAPVLVNQVGCYGTVELTAPGSGLTLLDPNGLTNHGSLEISIKPSGSIEIRGNIRNLLNAYVKLWDVEVTGNITNHGEMSIYDTYIDGSLMNASPGILRTERMVEFEGDIENAGLILVYPPAGEILTKAHLHNTGVIQLFGTMCVSNGTLFSNDTSGKITGYGLVGDQVLANKGSIYSNGGSLLLAVEGTLSNSGLIGNSAATALNVMHLGSPTDVNNSGTIEVNTGGGVAFDCNLSNEPNGLIRLLGGSLAAKAITQLADANFAGFGGITGDVVIDPNAIIKFTGPTNVVGDVQINTDATLQISDGTTLVTGHCTCTEGTIHMIGGAIILQGGFTNNNCRVVWEPGLYTNVADFNLDGKVNLEDFAYFADTWLWESFVH